MEELEPRQSRTVPRGGKELVNDGDPAVSTTPYVEIAIFRALIRKGSSGFSGYKNQKAEFHANKKALETAGDKGYVYVFRRDNFSPRMGNPSHIEWRSEVPARPIEAIEVRKEDLPSEITLVED